MFRPVSRGENQQNFAKMLKPCRCRGIQRGGSGVPWENGKPEASRRVLIREMLIKAKPGSELGLADVTPKDVYLNRRRFLAGLGMAGAAAVAGKRLYQALSPQVVHAGT